MAHRARVPSLRSASILHAHRNRAFVWGYGQLLIVTAIVATGAGLHVAAIFIEHTAHISPLATVLTVAVPVGVFHGLIYGLYYYLVQRSLDFGRHLDSHAAELMSHLLRLYSGHTLRSVDGSSRCSQA